MGILLLLMLVVLSIIAYKLHRLEKAQISSDNAKLNPTLSTSLNPLFSEQEIASQRILTQRWQEKSELYFNLLQKTEKEEIEEHQNSGKDKSEFKPSERLRNIILQQLVAITGRNATEATARQMIEANISILNGKSLLEVSEAFHREQGRVAWRNTNLDVHAWSNEPEIKKEFEKDLLARLEFWQSSWNYILEKDYLAKEET